MYRRKAKSSPERHAKYEVRWGRIYLLDHFCKVLFRSAGIKKLPYEMSFLHEQPQHPHTQSIPFLTPHRHCPAPDAATALCPEISPVIWRWHDAAAGGDLTCCEGSVPHEMVKSLPGTVIICPGQICDVDGAAAAVVVEAG